MDVGASKVSRKGAHLVGNVLHRLIVVGNDTFGFELCELARGAEAEDREVTADRQTLDEDLQGLLGLLNASATHGAASIHDKDEVEVLSLAHFEFLRICVRQKCFFLRLNVYKSGNEASHAGNFAVEALLVLQLRTKHVFSPVEESNLTLGDLVGLFLANRVATGSLH